MCCVTFNADLADYMLTATNDKTVAIGAKPRPINSIIISRFWPGQHERQLQPVASTNR
jgi:hypothetical protein